MTVTNFDLSHDHLYDYETYYEYYNASTGEVKIMISGKNYDAFLKQNDKIDSFDCREYWPDIEKEPLAQDPRWVGKIVFFLHWLLDKNPVCDTPQQKELKKACHQYLLDHLVIYESCREMNADLRAINLTARKIGPDGRPTQVALPGASVSQTESRRSKHKKTGGEQASASEKKAKTDKKSKPAKSPVKTVSKPSKKTAAAKGTKRTEKKKSEGEKNG